MAEKPPLEFKCTCGRVFVSHSSDRVIAMIHALMGGWAIHEERYTCVECQSGGR